MNAFCERAGSRGPHRLALEAKPGASCVRFPCPFYAQMIEKFPGAKASLGSRQYRSGNLITMSGSQGMAWKLRGRKRVDFAVFGGACGRLLHYLCRFRDRLIGRTSAFGAEYRGSSPRPGTRICLPPRTKLHSQAFECRCGTAEILRCVQDDSSTNAYLNNSHLTIVQQDNTDQSNTKRPETCHYAAQLIFRRKAQFQPARPARSYGQNRERDVA